MNKKDKTKTFQQLIEDKSFEIVEQYVKNLPNKINNVLENAMLSLIGISGSSGRYSIDHCNGRSSILTTVIKEIAQKDVKRLIKNKIATKDCIDIIKTTIDSELSSEVRYVVRQEIQKQLSPYVQKMIEEKLPEAVTSAIKQIETNETLAHF